MKCDVVAASRNTPVCEGSKLKDNSWHWGHLGQVMMFGGSDRVSMLHIDWSTGRGLKRSFLIFD